MSRRKRAVVYLKVSLADDLDALVKEIESFARRRRLTLVDIVISEAADAQPKLKRLLTSIQADGHVDLLVTTSFSHLGMGKLLHHMNEIEKAGLGVGFVREQMLLAPGSPPFAFAEKYVDGHRRERSRNIRHSLRVATLLGRVLGKPRLPENVKREAERHLRAGNMTLREIVRFMGGRISRSSLSSLKRQMKIGTD